MSGYSVTKQPRAVRPEGRVRRSADPCDLEFRLDLVGVRSRTAATLRLGDVLTVEIREHGTARSVVCVASGDRPVGTLAAFRGLAQLIRCLTENKRYIAIVEAASATRCAVLVHRVPE